MAKPGGRLAVAATGASEGTAFVVAVVAVLDGPTAL